MNTKPSSPHKLFETTELLSLPKIEPLSPLRFPTFQELLEKELESLSQISRTPSKPTNDLFAGMLGTLEPLLDDYQAHPEKYDSIAGALLEQLIHGMKSLEQLTTTERQLLNLATLDFFSPVKPKAEPPRLQPAESTEEEADPDYDEEQDEEEKRASADAKKPEAPVPGVDIPVTELPAYWWLQ